MATTTVGEYEHMINERAKEIAEIDPRFTAKVLTAIEGSDSLKELEGVLPPSLMKYMVLSVIDQVMVHYSRHASKGLFSSPTKHHGQARDISARIAISNTSSSVDSLATMALGLGPKDRSDDTPKIIKAIEDSALRPPINPKGSYANLCRAIVHKLDGVKGCEFTEAFKDSLGIESSKSFRPFK